MQKIKKLAKILTLFMLLVLLCQPLVAVEGFADNIKTDGVLTLPRPGLLSGQAISEVKGDSMVSTSSTNRYIVVMKPDVEVSRNAQGIQRAVVASGGRVTIFFSAAINGFAAELPPEALEQLRADPGVVFIEPDSVVSISGDSAVFNPIDVLGTQSDPVWGLDRIDQRNLPLDQTFAYDNTATNVHAYVVDTGILASHDEFSGRIGNGFTAFSDGYGVSDCHGHGTHVAGTIGGSTYGVAKEVNLHPVRVLGCDGKGSVIGVIAGLNWIIENGQTPGVVNMSLGGPTSDSLDIAVNNVIDAGFSVVVAAGNENSDACQVSPARAADAITVGATNSSDTRAWFSNYGTCLDLFAPGVSIKSAYNSSGTATAYLSGTSMAAPHVAGAAALYLQKDSSATPQNVTQFITNSATNGVINNAETGSPNQLLFLSSGPIPLQPTGTVLGGSPVFEWIKIEDVSQYQLELYERATDVLVDSRVISSDVCVQTKCSVDPGFSLDTVVGQYGWRTRVYDEEPFGEWTDMLFFNYAEPQHFYLPLIIRD